MGTTTETNAGREPTNDTRVPASTPTHAVPWPTHVIWAVFVLVPFLGSLLSMSPETGLILAMYGPAMAAVWLVGHAVILQLQRERRRHRLVAVTR